MNINEFMELSDEKLQTLTELDLSNSLTQFGLTQFGIFPHQYDSLYNIEEVDKFVGFIRKFCRRIVMCGGLKSLELGDNSLFFWPTEDLMALFNSIAGLKKLEYLGLRKNGIYYHRGDIGNDLYEEEMDIDVIEVLVCAIKNLRRLDLSDNALGCHRDTRGLRKIITNLPDCEQLEHLNLAQNKLGNYLINCARDIHFDHSDDIIFRQIFDCKNLQYLDLTDDTLFKIGESPTLIKEFCSFSACKNLKYLRFVGGLSQFSLNFCDAFRHAVSQCPSLSKIDLLDVRFQNVQDTVKEKAILSKLTGYDPKEKVQSLLWLSQKSIIKHIVKTMPEEGQTYDEAQKLLSSLSSDEDTIKKFQKPMLRAITQLYALK